MKKLLVILLFLPTLVYAQPYGNEWINFDQEYYKIMVPENGIYRITYNDLNNAGFPVAGTDPRFIQMFRRGQEIAIHFQGQDDGTLDPSDYLEFYGQKNDGKLDEALYVSPDAQPHQYFALYADSSAYFITIHPSQQGKRMEVLPSFTGATPESSASRQIVNVFYDQYARGETVGESTQLTQYDYGEGFTGVQVTEVSSPNRSITISGISSIDNTAPDPEIEVVVVGRNNVNHNFEVFVGPSIGSLTSIGTYNLNGYTHTVVNSTIDWASISAGGILVVQLSIIDDGGDISRISMSAIVLKYAQLTDLNNQSFTEFESRPVGSGGIVYNFTNAVTGSIAYDISEAANVKIFTDSNPDPNLIDCGFADGTIAKRLAIGVYSVNFSLHKVNIRPIDPSSSDYLIVSHPRVMKPAGGYNNAVEAYAGYRASSQGGDLDTLIADVTMLFNQFSYGQPTPLAIYHFIEYMYDLGDPKFLFLIGKGLDIRYRYHKRDSSIFLYKDLVPTAGSPGADLPYTVGLGADPDAPAIPVGRLSVMTPEEVINYLDKVVEIETTPFNALWRKDLLHLSGGNSLFELEIFKSYVDALGTIASGPYLGGEVTTVSKETTGTVEFINVSEQVNSGVNMITFFGHSAPNIIDVDIGMVSDPQNGYDNKGKYPLILMNGCSTGNIYDNQFVFGEDWISTAEKGATGVIAHSSYGNPFYLKMWSQLFYSFAYADSVYIEKSIGEAMIKTCEEVLNQVPSPPNYTVLTQVQQMGLQGDPAVKLFGTYVPDYEISDQNIDLQPFLENELVAEADSFLLQFIVSNYGAYREDSLEVLIKHTLPDETMLLDTVKFPAIRYLDTLNFVVNNIDLNAAGENVFAISLDFMNNLPEHDKTNNEAEQSFTIYSSGSKNVAPYEFRNQPNPVIDLIIQPGTPLMASRSYLIEIDTSANFQSMIKQDTVIQGKGIIRWNDVSLLSIDTAVYYWRSRYQNIIGNESANWATSSFSVIEGAGIGWAQLEFEQFLSNSFSGIDIDSTNKEFKFLATELPVEVIVHGKNSTNYTYEDTKLRIDGVNFIYYVDPWSWFTLCPDDRLNIVAFNKENAAPYAPVPGTQTDGWTSGRSPQVINSFNEGKSFDEIIDGIESGDKVILFTTGNFDFNSLTSDNLSRLEQLGATVSVLTNKLPGEPYIMVGYEGAGAGNALAEITADPADTIPTDEQTISFNGSITGIYGNATVASPEIGPADQWQNIQLAVRHAETSDEHRLDVYGVSTSGTKTLLFDDISGTSLDISAIDVNTYPYLKLELALQDTVNLTLPELNYWIIEFAPAAEGVLLFDSLNNTNEQQIELQEGEDLVAKFRFENISTSSFGSDSLVVSYRNFNLDTRATTIKDTLILAPEPGGSSVIRLPIDTKGIIGGNNLNVIVNPEIEPEQNYTNNRIELKEYLTVSRETINPVLDVSIDGEYIFDGDIVSPNPNIKIVIRDENPYLQKADTAGIDVFFKYPCESCFAQRISLSGPDIVWTPEDEKNPFEIDFSPKNLENGIYELQVQVADASGNASGIEPYTITFEVINESTVTNFYPYPNPFSTSVKFIFTLTGSEPPEAIMIRIMTVSGRVVKEIMQEELGPIKIGNNVTDYAWDGKDQFGDQLANGVYLYKVFIRKNGQNVELRPSGGDRGFANGYGKLYLLR